MKVKELIQELQKLKQDKEVYHWDHEYNCRFTLVINNEDEWITFSGWEEVL